MERISRQEKDVFPGQVFLVKVIQLYNTEKFQLNS